MVFLGYVLFLITRNLKPIVWRSLEMLMCSLYVEVEMHNMGYNDTRWRTFIQNGVYLYKIAYIYTRWRTFIQDGVNLYKMARICTRWRTFIQDGAY